ncbi:hypothetical protein ACE193_20290 [Bernardetia sp. OM2101]|uniref:hypothetical protein n=1 Tax=Bernardetia sp. OM2101 TaxID=3344876 RepID=UPI0035CF5833
MDATASKTELHLKVSSEMSVEINNEELGLYGLHHPHNSSGEPAKTFEEIAFIEDENRIYKGATITIHEDKIDSQIKAIGEIKANETLVSLEQAYIAWLGHEIFHDMDEEGIQRAYDLQNGRESNYDTETQTDPLTEQILKDMKAPKMKIEKIIIEEAEWDSDWGY